MQQKIEKSRNHLENETKKTDIENRRKSFKKNQRHSPDVILHIRKYRTEKKNSNEKFIKKVKQ